ncbi:MAG: COX15/CtaA family protein [Gemmatimonadaceae bacterium]|nr:COX15/CtaA family protein [Gemmatimonadaceae bacterium]
MSRPSVDAPSLRVPGTPVAPVTHAPSAPSAARAIRAWMIASALAVVLTLVVGGATRLTESGLSITEWKPVSGVLPPLDAAAWQQAYDAYLQIPEAQTVHRGITLPQFQTLFWWEWAHRLSARIAGLVIAVPFLVLLLAGRIPSHLRFRLASLPLLTAAQGALGWYMVTSGLSDRTDVSQYRLVAHLSLALAIYVIAAWTAFTVPVRRALVHRGALLIGGFAFLTIVSGGFVAGLDAGHIFNTFPRMGDGLVPPGYGQLSPAWRNLFENAASVQFNHRVLAVITLLLVAGVAWRERRRHGALSAPWVAMVGAVLVQVTLGISTLLLGVPLGIAALHQLGAVALLTTAIWAASAPVRVSPGQSSGPS